MPQALGIAGGVVGIAGGLNSVFNKPKFPKPPLGVYSTPFSSLQPSTSKQAGFVSIDPTIRDIRRQTLENLPGYRDTLTGAYSGLTGNLTDIRSRLMGNQNPFVEARVAPLLERGARTRGDLVQGMTRRGIFGPLYSQTLGGFEADLSRQEADARALAEAETLTALTGLDLNSFNAAMQSVSALRGLDAQQLAVVAADLEQELAAMGLSQVQIGQSLAALGIGTQQELLRQEQQGRGLYTLGAGLESLGRNWPWGGGGYEPPGGLGTGGEWRFG